MTPPRPKLLAVDDEPHLLAGLKRHLCWNYDLTTCDKPLDAIRIVQEAEAAGEPFDVVISDMRMPIMDGAQLLETLRKIAPDTVRLLLTGFSDLKSTIAAINNGRIFRFLNKPITPTDLKAAIDDAFAQRQLITAERDLLGKTLTGAVTALTQTLAMSNERVFGRAGAIARHADALMEHVGIQERWPIRIAVTLSQLPLMTLPPQTLERLHRGAALTEAERRMVSGLPDAAIKILEPIPRLDQVVEIVRYHRKNFDGSGLPADGVRGPDLPIGARILRVATDYEAELANNRTPGQALGAMASREGSYDPELLAALEQLAQAALPTEVVELTFEKVRIGMVLMADVYAVNGMHVLGRGHEVTPAVRERLDNFSRGVGLVEPLLVERVIPGASGASAQVT